MECYKILFIDDEEDVLLNLEKIFTREKYLNLFFANNVKEGLHILDKNDIDIIVSDQKMPGMSGIDLFKISKDKYPDALRILLAGNADLSETIEAVNEGEIYRYISKPLDITELRGVIKTAIDYVKLKRENKNMTEEIRCQKIELKAVNKELEDFSYSVSHDLKSPLRAVNSFSQIIKEKYESKFDVEFKRLFNIVIKNAQQINQTIKNILKLFKVDKNHIRYTIVDQNEVIDKIILEIKNNDSDNIKIDWKINYIPPVYTNYDLIYQVWFNLISNAVKYSSKKENPVIEITGTIEGKQIICSVKDNGVGFEQTYVSKLFKAFQRLQHKNEFSGAGIGLAIVEKIIKKHGGKVWAKGVLEHGAEFFFSLPNLIN